MPGAGRSQSAPVRAIGAIVALIAVVGYLVLGWSWNASGNTIPTATGIVVALTAVGWTLYSRVAAG